ncbi:hypothetical protein BGW80DRAFT_880422 [Lactifluus volemus]|nr:hypothetical protein BGW80DRAFT_880422 [Lactifluus volemus]
MAKVESTDDNLYDGLYGDEFEEDFAVSALGNPTALTDPSGDVTPTEFLEPPPDDPSFATPTTTTTTSASTTTTTTLPLETDVAQPIPTLDSSRTRSSADATLPPKPNSNGAGTPLSYSAQVAEQFSSSYRQTPSQERVRLDAARFAQFNQTGAPSGSPTTSTASAALAASGGAVVIIDGQARPVRPSEMKDEGCVFQSPHSIRLVAAPPPPTVVVGPSCLFVCECVL